MKKSRITITVDHALIEEVNALVSAGDAESLSAWVAQAIRIRSEEEHRLAHLRASLDRYQQEHGTFSDAELAAQEEADRDAAALTRANRQRRKAG